MSQNSNLLLLKSCPHQASTLQITLASTFFFAKEKSALGRKDSDSSTSAKVGGAGLGRDHHEWGQWREEGSEILEGEAATGEGPPRVGAWKSPGRACQVAGGPGHRPSEGHVARAGRCHRAPRVGRAAGEEPPGAAAGRGAGPCPRPPRLGSPPSWGSSGRRLGTSRPGTSSSPRPADPPPPRSGHKPELRAPPADTGCGKSSLGSGSRLAHRTLVPLALPAPFHPSSLLTTELLPVRPRVFTGTRGGDDSSVPPLRWQPVPSPDYSD